ncbi:MAG: MBOAT family protein [Lachnospiraceae bacterium]|nr:MBOAT family protein [Lachnospiraceae bacterium]
MDFLSLAFVLFVGIALILYYVLPGRYQRLILLLSNLVFYLICGKWNLIFIVLTSATVWFGAFILDRISDRYKEARKAPELSKEDKKKIKNRYQNYKRLVLWTVLLFNFGILAYMKYLRVLAGFKGGLLLPLGISFYTFMATGYLIDIYGNKYASERNFFRFLLFISFFPQLVQGPINRYDQMAPQFNEVHKIDADRMKRGVLLILYGLMKKYAIANMLSGSIESVLGGQINTMPGSLIVFAILMYSAEQYADFSGGIDIVMGVALLFDIRMMPNFRQPYFSTSLGDFWRRWHISLGAWMRDYVFYPFALLKPIQNFGKWCTSKFNKHLGRVLPAGIANILVFFLVGLWHGAAAHYIWWGLYNGFVIAISDILEPFFKGLSKKMHLTEDSNGMRIFRIIRTFIIVNIGWYFDRIDDLGRCLSCLGRSVTAFGPSMFVPSFKLVLLNSNEGSPIYAAGGMCLAFLGCVIVFIVSFLKEKGIDVACNVSAIMRKSGFGFAVVALAMLVLISFVFMSSAGGFLYANF